MSAGIHMALLIAVGEMATLFGCALGLATLIGKAADRRAARRKKAGGR